MNKDILFSEIQKFKQWWLWLIIGLINGLFVIGIIVQIIFVQQFGTSPMTDTELIITTLFSFIITLLFSKISLETIIKQEGIYVRFFPFHLKFKYYSWGIIQQVSVIHYNPLLDYGGWGLRFGFFGKGIAYTISGTIGLHIQLKNNNKLLIGTKQPEHIVEVLNNMQKLTH